MDSLVPYAIYLVLALAGLSLVALVAFGLRNLTFGKVDVLTIVLVMIPVAIMVVLGFVTGDWPYAGILAFLITLGVTALSLLLSGLRGVLGM